MVHQPFIDQEVEEHLKARGFLVIKTIGRGAYGVVKKALKGDRYYAIKFFIEDVAYGKRGYISRLEWWGHQEGEVNSRIRHENVVSVRQVVHCDQGIKAVIYDYIDGQDLMDVITSHFRLVKSVQGLPFDQVQQYSHQILSALSTLHHNHLIHHDVKLENILIETKTNQVKLLDFGLSQNIRFSNSIDSKGTLGYAAPEILQKREHDTSVDMWSFGIVFYIMITGDDTILDMAPEQKQVPFFFQYLPGFSRLMRYKPACEMLNYLLEVNPKKRWTADQCLQSPFFHQIS